MAGLQHQGNLRIKRQKSTEIRFLESSNCLHSTQKNLNTLLADVPERFTMKSNTIIEFPTKNGVIQKFRVYEASILAPSLQAQHPSIRSYTAQGIDDPSAVARFSYSNVGLNVYDFIS